MNKPNMFVDLLYTISKWFSRHDEAISKFIVLGLLGTTTVGSIIVMGVGAFHVHVLIGILYVIAVILLAILILNGMVVKWYETKYGVQND